MSYSPPTPPESSGIHRYFFLLCEQDGIIDITNISERVMTMSELYKKLTNNNNNNKLIIKEISGFTSEFGY
jgi:phosphatidylethanolamine-binding protein (PEBP) family uncharacterized protein